MNFPFTQGDASELLKSLGLSDSFIKCYFSLGLPCILSERVKVTQLCPTFCDLMNDAVYGILQARILEWVAFPFSRRSHGTGDRTQVSSIAGRFFTSWATTEAHVY